VDMSCDVIITCNIVICWIQFKGAQILERDLPGPSRIFGVPRGGGMTSECGLDAKLRLSRYRIDQTGANKGGIATTIPKF
jgi:hypothetical protein